MALHCMYLYEACFLISQEGIFIIITHTDNISLNSYSFLECISIEKIHSFSHAVTYLL